MIEGAEGAPIGASPKAVGPSGAYGSSNWLSFAAF